VANGLVKKPQLTMYDLFANALTKIDQRLPEGTARRDRWRRARSKLVDRFLNVTGDGRTPPSTIKRSSRAFRS